MLLGFVQALCKRQQSMCEQAVGTRMSGSVPVIALTGDEFGAGLNKPQLAQAADALLRAIQQGSGLINDDTGWLLRVNRKGRKKMGDNADLSPTESKAVTGIGMALEIRICKRIDTRTDPNGQRKRNARRQRDDPLPFRLVSNRHGVPPEIDAISAQAGQLTPPRPGQSRNLKVSHMNRIAQFSDMLEPQGELLLRQASGRTVSGHSGNTPAARRTR